MRRVSARLSTVVASVVAAAFLASGRPASAEPSGADTAAARSLFLEGRSLAEAHHWEEAVDRFERALALRPSVAIKYNLAAVLVSLGRLVEATELARAVLHEAPDTDPAYRAAETLLHQVESRLGRLTIRLAAPDDDVEVVLDGQVVSEARLGVATPVDPGRHVVVARRAGVETSRETNVPEGQAAEVVLPLPVAPAAAAPRLGVPVEEHRAGVLEDRALPPRDDGPSRGPRWPLVAVGAGLVGVGVVIDAVPASGRNGELDALDLVPVGLYVAGAVVAALGVL